MKTAPQPDILVVDDNPANLQLLVGMLQECGYRVRPVTSGAQGLRAVRAAPPDLVLLDITMPEMDGYEVCRRLKADPASREIPVLFVSALVETEDKVRAFEAGGVDFVSKPFQFAEVAARVRTHLQLRRQQRELAEGLRRERELEQLRDRLTHMIAHDMRSPLLAMNLTLNLIRRSAPPEDAALLAGAQAALQSLVEMITQMLDVSRMEAGALVSRPEVFDVAELAHTVLRSLQPLAGEVAVKVQADETVLAHADRELIRRVLANLVGNALKFAPTRGHVNVRVASCNGHVRVEVTDDGPGIDPKYHAKIFEKFGQVEADQKKFGTGLGLTFAKMVVEAQGGKIGVISAIGQGSTFWITLPSYSPASLRTLP